MEYEISRKEKFVDQKPYELTIEKGYWGAKLAFNSAEEYIEIVNGEGDRYNQFSSTLYELEERSIGQIEKDWRSRESKSLLVDRAWRIADWAGLLISLIMLALSVVYFNDWANKVRCAKFLVLSLLIQAGIFSSMFWLSTWDHFLITFLAFLVPGIWFYQFSVFGNKFYRSRKDVQNH